MKDLYAMSRIGLRVGSFLIFAGCLVACDLSKAQQESSDLVSRPTAEQFAQAQNTHYIGPSPRLDECIGRLIFTAAPGFEWGLHPRTRNGDHRFMFTRQMHGGQDYVGIGNVKVVVLQPAAWSDIEHLQDVTNAEKQIAVQTYEERIRVRTWRLEDLEAVLKDPSLNSSRDDLSRYPSAIAELRTQIEDDQTSIANINKDWHAIDLGLPESLGYAAGPTLYAFLLREGRAYTFMSTGGPGEAPFEERQRAFFELLKKFKVRKLHEIPTTPGICFPYGFIPDDGKSHFRTEVSMRYSDRPGVIYTIGTAVVGERGIAGPEAALINATARAAVGVLGGPLTAGRDSKTVGPRSALIGALPAYQGGVSMNVAEPGQPPVYSYSVYTGYPGWMHSRVLPAITVNMRSFTKEQEPTLKVDPPPLEESLGRLEALLQSIRLRPTTSPMPELAASPAP